MVAQWPIIKKGKITSTASMQTEEDPCTAMKISITIRDYCVKTLQNTKNRDHILSPCMCVCV